MDLSFRKVFQVSAVEDVLTDRAREEAWLLLNDSELGLMEPFVIDFLEVNLVVQQFALIGVVESLDELHDR